MNLLFTQLILVFLLYFFGSVNSEHRKLIPKCFNSCLNGPQSGNCFCDSKCSLIYNDCCLDAPFRSFRVNTQRIHDIHCVFVPGENKDFWMVDTCKKSWSGQDQVRIKCESANTLVGETNDVFTIAPVTSPKEEVTYKNYYCGLCNGETPEDLVEWQVKALCGNLEVDPLDVLQNLTYVEDKQQWGVWKSESEGSWTFNECYLLFQRPHGNIDGIRQCLANIVSTCPRSWRNIATRRRCKSYVDPIKWSDGPVYKNIDCAICNNQTLEGFQCFYDKLKFISVAVLNRAVPVDLSAMGQWF